MFLLVSVTALILAVGLVVDGGGIMYARDDLRYAAQQAARVGGQQLAMGAVLDGQAPAINQSAAITAGRNALADLEVDGTVTIEAGEVVVRTRGTYRPSFLVFLGTVSIQGSGRAAAVAAVG